MDITQNNKNIINELKEYIFNCHRKTTEKLKQNIYRGHLRNLSTDIEDAIALFVSKILVDYEIHIDPSIYINKKTIRPDMLIVNKNKQVVAMIEIKTQMGYCRNAEQVIDKIKEIDEIFKQNNNLTCNFSNSEKITVTYKDNVKLFLISLTDNNCSPNNHASNKEYASSKNVKHFNLFHNWYEDLEDYEIEEFKNELLNLQQNN